MLVNATLEGLLLKALPSFDWFRLNTTTISTLVVLLLKAPETRRSQGVPNGLWDCREVGGATDPRFEDFGGPKTARRGEGETQLLDVFGISGLKMPKTWSSQGGPTGLWGCRRWEGERQLPRVFGTLAGPGKPNLAMGLQVGGNARSRRSCRAMQFSCRGLVSPGLAMVTTPPLCSSCFCHCVASLSLVICVSIVSFHCDMFSVILSFQPHG